MVPIVIYLARQDKLDIVVFLLTWLKRTFLLFFAGSTLKEAIQHDESFSMDFQWRVLQFFTTIFP